MFLHTAQWLCIAIHDTRTRVHSIRVPESSVQIMSMDVGWDVGVGVGCGLWVWVWVVGVGCACGCDISIIILNPALFAP